MVNISEGGDLWWTHGEKVLGFFEDFHYSFVGSQDSTTAGLEISNASAEQAGFYEAILIKGSCHVRNAFEVRVEGKCCFAFSFNFLFYTSKRRN